MDISYIINHLGEERGEYMNSVTPPIFQTSMFSYPTVEDMRHALAHESEVAFYTRGFNPTTGILQKKIAALEHAEDCLVFSSGSAAIAAAVMANLKSGDHVVCVLKPYSWTNKLLNNLLSRFGISNTMVDGREVKNIESAIRPETRIIFLESPNSWTFEQQDIQAIADIARKNNILSIIDNSYASPLYQNPIGMGIDMVTHSATKYLSGHSDAVAGVLCGSKEMMKNIFASEFMTIGAVISPFNAWLLLRGLRTLPIRMEKVSRSTPEIVAFLEQHPKVAKVYYPYSESDPQYELSIKQMCKPAGQFSIQLKTESKEEVEKFCNRLKRFLMACSWGGYESLIFPAIVLYTSENYQNKDLSWDLVRFYIGLEEPEVLIEDIKQALEGMQ